MFAPMTFGPTFYNGMSHFQDMVTNMLLSPVGHFSTILTSLVWLKFSIVRQEKRWHNISIALLTVVIVSISFYASTSFMNVYKREGILAGLAGATEAASAFSYTFQIVVNCAIIALFLVSNTLWLIKLRKAKSFSEDVASIAKTCVKMMFAQIVLLSMSLMSALAAMAAFTDDKLRPTTTSVDAADQLINIHGEVTISFYAFCAMFLDPVVEALIGLVQVMAMRTLSSSSSSSSAGKTELQTTNEATV